MQTKEDAFVTIESPVQRFDDQKVFIIKMIIKLMVKFRYSLISGLLCVIPIHAGGQDVATQFPWMAGSSVYTGFLLNHHNNMRILNEATPYIFEIFIAKPTDGEKEWQSFYRHPLYGVSCMMLNTGSPSYLGKAHAVYQFMNFSLNDAARTVNLNLRVGTGIAYVEKKFDRFDNYKNRAISTHWNVLLSFRMECKLRVAPPLYLSGGWGLTHISNGAFTKPNAGLNYITVFAGANYAFGKERIMKPVELNEYDIDRKWYYTLYLSGGVKSYTINDDMQYAAWGLSLEASRSHLAFTRFSGALDLFYDTSDYFFLLEKEMRTSKIQTVKPALAAGYEFLFGALSARVQMGGYLYAKNTDYGRLYQRLALSYTLTRRLNIRFGLKTHWGQADYIELSVGYRIR